MEKSDTKQGICLECGKPLENPNSFGYHYGCSAIVHERSNKEADENFPFVVIGFDGVEIDRFNLESKAKDFLWNINNAKIVNKSL